MLKRVIKILERLLPVVLLGFDVLDRVRDSRTMIGRCPACGEELWTVDASISHRWAIKQARKHLDECTGRVK